MGPFGKMCVHLRRFDVNLIVTCDGAKGLIKARPGRTIEFSLIGKCWRACFSSVDRDSDVFIVSDCT